MTDKIVINPALLEALEHYSRTPYDLSNPTLVVIRDQKGRSYPWTVEDTCRLALDALGNEDLSYLKLKILQAGLKKHGFDDLYQRIMGEPLP